MKNLNKNIFVNPLGTIELNEPYEETDSDKAKVWDEVEDETKDFKINLNPDSLKVITGKIEPSVKDAKPQDKFQFQR